MTAKARKASRKKSSRHPIKKKIPHGFLHRNRIVSFMAGAVMALLAFAIFIGYVCQPFVLHFSQPIDPEYFKDYNIRGIDISHYQYEINWEALKKAKLSSFPIRFVIIKATEGCNYLDHRFRENFSNARRHNFVRGAYHFFNPNSSAQTQAEYYLQSVQLQSGDMPPILDVEQRGDKKLEQFQNDVLTWLSHVHKATGVTPILYTNASFRYHYLRDIRFETYPFWVAHYNMRYLRYKGAWIMWQYSDRGRIDGINHDVDLNLFNGNFSDLQRLLIP